MIALHLGIAERGKQLALCGRHVDALRHYREAMRHAQRDGAPELFLRHYTQCALESLERAGACDEVLATCERARAHYQAHPPADDVARKDRASFCERAGVQHLRGGRHEAAMAAFSEALASAGGLPMPLARTLHGWLRSGLHIAADRLERELERQRYWSVRADSVRADWAVSLPGEPINGL